MDSNSLGLDAIYQYTGSGVQLISGMVFYLFIVRLFNSSAVGAVALFLAIIGLFNVVFSFGLTKAAQHFTSFYIGNKKYASVRKTVFKIIEFALLLSIGGCVVLFFLSPQIALIFLHSLSYTGLVRLLSVVLLGYIIFGILNGILLGIQNFRLSAIINILIWIFYYFGAVAFAIYFRSLNTILLGWALGIFLGVIVEFAAVLLTTKQYANDGVSPTNRFLFAFSLPVVFSGLISYGATSVDRFVVSGLLNLGSLGVYNFSLLIVSSIGFLSVPFNNILLPKFSEMYGRGGKNDIANSFRFSSTLLSFFYVPAALGIAALSPTVLGLLGGSNVYVQGAIALKIIMFSSAMFITVNIIAHANRRILFALWSQNSKV